MKVIATIEGENINEHDDGSVTYTSKAHVDADGAGGNPYNDPDYQPLTSLRQDGGRSLDAKLERFIVVPPSILHGTKGVVLGCQVVVGYNGKACTAVVGDIGPTAKLGEISVACAAALGMDSNPRNGGVDEHRVHYILWPGIPAIVDGKVYRLQPAAGVT